MRHTRMYVNIYGCVCILIVNCLLFCIKKKINKKTMFSKRDRIQI